MAFSTIIKKLREENNLSQKDIAEYLGITRQAVAAYELAKREPDYEVLKKLADFFGVSVDYLLGRVSCKDINVLTVAKNIKFIKGNLTFEEFSKDIFRKTGTMITPEMLELYTKGERMPFIGTIRVLAQYASVPESFFYRHNTPETYHQEKKMYMKEVQQLGAEYYHGFDYTIPAALNHMDVNLAQWVMNKNNLKYIRLAKEMQESGLPIESVYSIIDVLKSINKGKE
ncbi:MAG: helix-turn-helix transcriptional regulator [Firmicutes bacterium]|nr:helix-turn-helix transcriptional regulator [Bacillota bacterium]